MSGNARQQRAARRSINGDHFRWPLGTPVIVRAGHHSPAAFGLRGKVNKHGYPCKDGTNCLVEFPQPVVDMTFSHDDPTARYCHYIDYKQLRRVRSVL